MRKISLKIGYKPSETMCLALTHIFKIVNEGPVINPSFPNKSRSITYRP